MKRFLSTIFFALLALTTFAQYGSVIAASNNNHLYQPFWLAGGVPASSNYTVYDPAHAATEADSYFNIVNKGTRDAIPQNSPTFTLGLGWTGNSSNMYLDTQTKVNANSTIIVLHQNANNGRFSFGVGQSSPTRQMSSIPYSSVNAYFEISVTSFSSKERHPNGVIALTTTSGYRNGIKDVSTSTTWSGGATTHNVYLLARNAAGTPSTFFGGTICMVAIYDIELTDNQILAVSNAMMAACSGPLNSYSSKVLALSPTVYLPLNDLAGFTFVRDFSGLNQVAYCRDVFTSGHDSPYGNAFYSDASGNSQIEINCTQNYFPTLYSFNIDECSFSFWFKFESGASNPKLLEIWSLGLNNYVAWEIRNTNELTIHIRTNGVNQDISTGILLTAGVWTQIVAFNSVLQNKVGYYVDGVKTEYTKTTGGTTNPNNLFAQIGGLRGYFNHLAIFDYALSQSNLNSLQ